MKRGFTLLELLIVIIIIGVLATIGFTQYSAVVERSRGAEARQIIGQLRSICAGLYMNQRTAVGCTNANLNIGTVGADTIPGNTAADCRVSHYFTYNSAPAAGTVVFTATRCEANGKAPNAPALSGRQLQLTTDYAGGGLDVWASNFGY